MSARRRKGNIDNDRTEVVISQCTDKKKTKAKYEKLDTYWNFDSQRLVPISKATVDRLRENAIEWAIENENAIKIGQFLIENKIMPTTWNRWRKKHPEIQEAHEVMKLAIGNRREVGLITRKFEPGSTIFMMPHYDEDWKIIGEWRSKLNQKETIQAGQQFIVIEKTANSPLVPKRKEEE